MIQKTLEMIQETLEMIQKTLEMQVDGRKTEKTIKQFWWATRRRWFCSLLKCWSQETYWPTGSESQKAVNTLTHTKKKQYDYNYWKSTIFNAPKKRKLHTQWREGRDRCKFGANTI